MTTFKIIDTTADGKTEIVFYAPGFGSSYPSRPYGVKNTASGMIHAFETEAKAKASAYYPAS